MSYTSAAEVRQALARDITDPDNPPATQTYTAADMSNDTLLDAIAEADATIDSYIGGRYAVPVADVNGATPAPITFWSRTIASYLATLTYRKGQDLSNDDPVVRRYTAIMSAMVAVRDGKAFLTLPANTGDGAAAGAGEPVNPYAGKLFGPGDWSQLTADGDSFGRWPW